MNSQVKTGYVYSCLSNENEHLAKKFGVKRSLLAGHFLRLVVLAIQPHPPSQQALPHRHTWSATTVRRRLSRECLVVDGACREIRCEIPSRRMRKNPCSRGQYSADREVCHRRQMQPGRTAGNRRMAEHENIPKSLLGASHQRPRETQTESSPAISRSVGSVQCCARLFLFWLVNFRGSLIPLLFSKASGYQGIKWNER